MNLKPLTWSVQTLLCTLVLGIQFSLSAQNAPTTAIDYACTNGQSSLVLLPLDNDDSGNTNFDLSTLSIVNAPANGTVTVDNNLGSLSYDWLLTTYGLDVISYRICNTSGLCDTNVVDVFVNKANSLYVTDDHYSSLPGETIAGNVLKNDYDPEGDQLSVSIVQNASYGSFSLSANGDFSYVATNNYSGYDIVSYQVCDNHVTPNCETAKIHLHITPVVLNSVKSLVDYKTEYQIMADHTLTGENLNDFSSYNINPANVNVTILNTTTNGALVLSANGGFNYTPNLGFVGNDVFSFQICDVSDNTCITSTGTIHVVDNPISCGMSLPMLSDDLALVKENGQANGRVLENDQDLTAGFFNLNTTPTQAPQNGTVVLNNDGSYTYNPDAGFFGSDQFSYEVCLTDPVASVVNETTQQPIDKTISNFITESTLEVTHCGTIDDVNLVNLDIAHTNVSQMAVQLISPAGTTQTMIINGCESTVITGSIDDEAGASLPCPTTNFVAAPAHPLSKFDGESCCGTWKLVVLNYQPNVHSGVLKNWALDIACASHKSLGCREATATMLVLPQVKAPVALEDCYTHNPGLTTVMPVVENDFDEDYDLDAKSVTISSNGSFGVASVDANGTVTYMSNTSSVTDYFTYEVCDTLGQCDQAIVKVLASAVVDLDFTGFDLSKNDNGNALVEWTTENEDRVSHFVIERKDNDTFTALGEMEAYNESNNNYSFVDIQNGLNGKYFYRVKSIDLDGEVNYTMAKSLEWNRASRTRLMPNPSKGNITINSSENILEVQIVGTLGQLTQPVTSATSIIDIDASELMPGRYTARVTTTSGVEMIVFVKI